MCETKADISKAACQVGLELAGFRVQSSGFLLRQSVADKKNNNNNT